MNRYGKRCVLYPRVSTEMQVDGYSLEGQKNMLTRFADREEMIVVDTYEDAGKSGKSIEGRPAFQKMLRDIEDGLDIDYILVYKLSRFGRNAADARLRRDAIKQQAITLENIYKIMVNFDCVYNIINDEEKRNVVTALIKEIEIYRNDESEYPLKRIGLNFPVFKDGGEVTELLWDKGNTVETVCLLVK